MNICTCIYVIDYSHVMVHTTNIVQLMFPHCQVKCLDDPLSVGPAMVVLRVDRENLWGKTHERMVGCVVLSHTYGIQIFTQCK